MKNYRTQLHTLAMLFASLWLCCSCIDEYNADLPSSETTYLVVEGYICGNSECQFTLSRSLSLSPTDKEILARMVSDANVSICGSDGTKIRVPLTSSGIYTTHLGALNPETEYWLAVEWTGNTYTSKATKPLQTPGIVEAHYEQPRDDKQVDIFITPAAPKAGETQYFRWSYAEDWEIRTPYHTNWEYNPETDDIEPIKVDYYRGWCKDYSHTSVISNNKDYVNGEIHNLRLLSLDNMDNRFNYLYCASITQRAISLEEYEYERLSQRQNDDMGGLFTPQPSELPSNIYCTEGNGHALGYIGVSLNKELVRVYVRGSKVGWKIKVFPSALTDEQRGDKSRAVLHQLGYRVSNYIPEMGQDEWIEPYAVDCRMWGATLNKPDFWEDGDPFTEEDYKN